MPSFESEGFHPPPPQKKKYLEKIHVLNLGALSPRPPLLGEGNHASESNLKFLSWVPALLVQNMLKNLKILPSYSVGGR